MIRGITCRDAARFSNPGGQAVICPLVGIGLAELLNSDAAHPLAASLTWTHIQSVWNQRFPKLFRKPVSNWSGFFLLFLTVNRLFLQLIFFIDLKARLFVGFPFCSNSNKSHSDLILIFNFRYPG